MDKLLLKKLHKLMIKANKFAVEGQSIEHQIQNIESELFKENVDDITSSDYWEDEIVASYTNAEFSLYDFKEFEEKVKFIVKEVMDSGK